MESYSVEANGRKKKTIASGFGLTKLAQCMALTEHDSYPGWV